MKFLHLAILNGTAMVLLLISVGIYAKARVDDYTWKEIFNNNDLFNDTRRVLGTMKNWREAFRHLNQNVDANKINQSSSSSRISQYLERTSGLDEDRMAEKKKKAIIDSTDRHNIERATKMEDKVYTVGIATTALTSILVFCLPFCKQVNAGLWSIVSEYTVLVGFMAIVCLILMMIEASSIAKTNNTYRDLEILVSPKDNLTGAMLLTSCYKQSSYFDTIVKKNGWDKLRDDWEVCEGFEIKVTSTILVGLAGIIYTYIGVTLYLQSVAHRKEVNPGDEDGNQVQRPSYLPDMPEDVTPPYSEELLPISWKEVTPVISKRTV